MYVIVARHNHPSPTVSSPGEIEEAKKTLQGAIMLPGVKTIGRKASAKQRATEISVNDRVSVFLELAEAHLSLDEQVGCTLSYRCMY